MSFQVVLISLEGLVEGYCEEEDFVVEVKFWSSIDKELASRQDSGLGAWLCSASPASIQSPTLLDLRILSRSLRNFRQQVRFWHGI